MFLLEDEFITIQNESEPEDYRKYIKIFLNNQKTLENIIMNKRCKSVKIRKMSKKDLQYVNKNFYYGKLFNLKTLKSNYIYVAEEKQKIIGILFADVTITGTAILFALEVLEEYRKIGIASKLMKIFENDCVKNGIETIMVFYNKFYGIEKFYIKFNFEIGTNLEIACKSLVVNDDERNLKS